MTGFSEIPGQGPILPGGNPENLQGLDEDRAPRNPRDDPGRTLGIVGFVLSFFTALIGMIVSIIALVQSRRAGFSNGWAVAGIVIGAIEVLIGAALAVLFLSIGFAAIGSTN
ncbi:DUF4190 domain-containing protein [Rathayibacter sp. YIM 133350]|uniref:DUF4190 domain-containing protein n=1 Tax=Rathayibacter sp. YIM 133350 TaxID=3131992 RepID=UPI00307DA96D